MFITGLRKTLIAFLLAMLVLFSFQIAVAKQVTLKETAEFFWKYVLKTGEEPAYDQLQDVASFLKGYNLDKTGAVITNHALSNRQKAENVDRIIPGSQKYGIVVTMEGEEYEGVISFRVGEILFILLEGGNTSITLDEIREITATRHYKRYIAEGVFKREDGQLINFSKLLGGWRDLSVTVYNQNLGRINIEGPKRIIFGTIKQIKCPNCWETMEFDWNYCPYCGTKLNTEGGFRKPVSNPSSSQGPNNTDTEEIVGRGNLKLVITTPLTAVYSLGRKDLIVTLDGPATFDKTISDVPTAHPEVVEFNDIPQGIYTVTATYGNKKISKQIGVGSDTLEFKMVMY